MLSSGKINYIPEDILVRLPAAAGAVVIVLGTALYSYWGYGYGFLFKPFELDLSLFGMVRIALSCVAALLLFRALRPSLKDVPDRSSGYAADTLMAGAMAIAAGLLVLVSLVMVFSPEILGPMIEETQPIAAVTDFLLAGAVLTLLATAWRLRASGHFMLFGRIPGFGVLIGLALVTFVLLMEEMSYGQHWLGFGTPEELFAGNIQNETNLHNFYTHRFEAVYYTIAVGCFVVLPWMWPLLARVPLLRDHADYAPPLWMAILAMPVCTLIFEAWHILIFQVYFFLGLFICLHIARQQNWKIRFGLYLLALIYASSQVIFLAEGSELLRGYELSEIRELYIGFSLLAYSLVLYQRAVAVRAQPANADFKSNTASV
ncbi:hypothetical protein [Pseudohoeflea coraliihabitans]|uniref:DUF2157 domain-containing protein n=1 Tax=Pseudohoeflea coraliihabitans TaxID=2860393 RepID=A0ABS6WM23_9HYPH|nr:hypothetical protein [Pseudohoeflea sp. DP4N28-3]MBW3097011.1 hypothetical protein [Pseudohoeflea sp. DP4N28-3]